MTKGFEVAMVDKMDIAAAAIMYSQWAGESDDHNRLSPLACLKKILGMDLEIETETFSTKANVMELCMLKLAEKAIKGDMAAIQTIIKEVQHGGVEKHQYVDGLPDDIKYLYADVEFTDVTDVDTPKQLVQASVEHKEALAKKEQSVEELINSWG